MKKIMRGLFVLIGLSLSTYSWAATTGSANLSFSVGEVLSITINSVTMPANNTAVVPSGAWLTSAITGAQWSVINPVVVNIASAYNNATKGICVYTKHNTEAGWTASNTTELQNNAVTINGLINYSAITSKNINDASVPLRLFADFAGTSTFVTSNGVVTSASTSTDDSLWHWIPDTSYSIAVNPAKEYLQDNFNYTSLNLFIRQAWTAGKRAGTYGATVVIAIEGQ